MKSDRPGRLVEKTRIWLILHVCALLVYSVVLLGLLSSGVARLFFPPAVLWAEVILQTAVVMIVAERLVHHLRRWVESRRSSGEPRPAIPDPPEPPEPSEPPEPPEEEPTEEPDPRAAYQRALDRLRELEERAGVGAALPERAVAEEVAAITEAYLRWLPETRSRELARLRERAAELVASGESSTEPSGSTALLDPASWQERGPGNDAGDYHQYLEHELGRVAREVEAASSGSRASMLAADCQTVGEDLLRHIGSTRAEHPGDPKLGEIYSRLLGLLSFSELRVEIGDRYDRDLHDAVARVATREHAANRVVHIVQPGYRDATGRIRERAQVHVSEQIVS